MNPIHVLPLERVGFDPKSFLHVHEHRRGLSILKAISLCFMASLLKMYDQMFHLAYWERICSKFPHLTFFTFLPWGLD